MFQNYNNDCSESGVDGKDEQIRIMKSAIAYDHVIHTISCGILTNVRYAIMYYYIYNEVQIH